MEKTVYFGAGGTEPFTVGKICLDILLQLVRLQPACDSGGNPLLPQPLAPRQIAGPEVLPHIAQVNSSWGSFSEASACCPFILLHVPFAEGHDPFSFSLSEFLGALQEKFTELFLIRSAA